MTTEELISKSMVYERAYGKVSAMLKDLREQRNVDLYYAHKTGSDNDESFDLIVREMEASKKKLRKCSDDLWRGAEKSGQFHIESIKELLGAVVLRAANDYEMAVSGEGNPEEQARIEKFAEEDAGGFTGIYFPDVLKRIRECQPEFARIARENISEIVDESERNRRSKHADMSQNKHRCPLCGGGMFSQSKCGYAYQVVCCTGCSLREVVPVPKRIARKLR